MRPAKVHLIGGTRPNFVKVAPLYHALKQEAWCRPILIHTGQHYDADMSEAFFRDLHLPAPDRNLGVGSGTHAQQTAGIMVAYEKICREEHPNWVIVVGDVNSTLACALTAKKRGLRLAHLEAGLRSRDMTMPEEINRLLTDAISDLLWTPSPDADENLRNEGIPQSRILRIGNIMIDSYEMLRGEIEEAQTASTLGFLPGTYGVITLHRPVNVDQRDSLTRLTAVLQDLSDQLPVVFPVHPRTRNRLEDFGLWAGLEKVPGLFLSAPMGYIGFMSLVKDARLVITDSGGIQEETTYLNIPCLTLRETTERPITITQGTNRLVKVETLRMCVQDILAGRWVQGTCPEFWDGRTALRATISLKERLQA